MHKKYVDWPLCVINANILIIGHRYAALLYRRKYYLLTWFSYVGKCLWVINVEGHAAHCRMASTTISIPSNKKARLKNSTRNVNVHLVMKCQGIPSTTKRLPIDGENLARLDVFLISKLALLKPDFLWESPYSVKLSDRFFRRHL